MADEPDDDVLDLDKFESLPPEDDDDDQQGDDGDGKAGDDEGEETFVGFGEEDGGAPPPEADSSVIRDLRRANRELARKVHGLERQAQPQPIEIGPKPTLAGCDYDEDRFEADHDAWKDRKEQSERAGREVQERTKAEQEQWQQRAAAYQADKAKLPLPDFATAEEEVFASLSEQHKALILLTDKPAAIVYALAKAPDKLEQLSKLDLARAAMMLGKLEDKVTVTKRKPPQPDTPVKGNAPLSASSQDRELARLTEEADRTGDLSKVAAFKYKLKTKAAR